LIVRREPHHRIGLLFLVMGVSATVTEVAEGYATHPTYRGVDAAQVVANCGWLAGAGGYALLALWFPTGRAASRWWSLLVPVVAFGGFLAVLGTVFGTAGEAEFAAGTNPYARAAEVADAAWSVGTTLITVALVVAIVSLIGRYRRGGPVERQQVRLLAYALVALAVVAPFAVTMHDDSAHVRIAIAVVVTAIPCAVCVAILRYRLYEVDRAAQAALVYGTLTLLLAVAFASTTLFIASALGRDSAVATAGATLLVVVAFVPLRARIQDVVDRWFRRARYDALEEAGRFMERLRVGDAVPEQIGDLLRRLLDDPGLAVLLPTTAPAGWVDEDAEVVPAPTPGDDTVLLESGGLVVGALVLDRIPPDRRPLVGPVTAATVLAVEMARLRMDIRLQLATVEAARERVVAAAEGERLRIQRDLHDGAQQRLVSVGLALRHVQHEIVTESGDPSASLDGAVEQVLAVIVELREMASGRFPSNLDDGLEAALRDLADRAKPTPVTVELPSSLGRLPRPVEAAAYFVACEGLTNAIKHARAAAVVIGASCEDQVLHLTIDDDGGGGANPSLGTGLRGLDERVHELGGTLRLSSPEGTGTTITVEIPCGS